jgi:hypothetical protein
MERTALPKSVRILAEFLVVGICTVGFIFTALGIGTGVAGHNGPGGRDFVEYWASGQQLTHHADPYDGSAMLPLERSAGLAFDVSPMVMGNAPPALLLVVPLGLVSAKLGELLWILLLLACFIASVRIVRSMHGAPGNKRHFLGYTFAPALLCLGAAQVSLVILLGYVLFLRWYRFRPYLAGAALWFCTLKPQLFLPFGVVLLAWIIVSKSYRILAGAVSTFAASTFIVYLLDPRAWAQYHAMMAVSRYDKLPIPCLSIVLRRTISPDTMWLQYLPAVLGCIWAIAYFQKHRDDWDWMKHGSLLILVSVLVAPYTWLIDQAILLPAVLHGVYVTRSRNLLALLALATAAIEIAPMFGMKLMLSAFYVWTSPAWLAWYLCAMLLSHPKLENAPTVSVVGERSMPQFRKV